jgi:hypothetical protein
MHKQTMIVVDNRRPGRKILDNYQPEPSIWQLKSRISTFSCHDRSDQVTTDAWNGQAFL